MGSIPSAGTLHYSMLDVRLPARESFRSWAFDVCPSQITRVLRRKSRDASTSLGMTTIARPCGFHPSAGIFIGRSAACSRKLSELSVRHGGSVLWALDCLLSLPAVAGEAFGVEKLNLSSPCRCAIGQEQALHRFSRQHDDGKHTQNRSKRHEDAFDARHNEAEPVMLAVRDRSSR